MNQSLPEASLDQIFRAAHSHNKWQDRAVSDDKLHELYDLLKWGPIFKLIWWAAVGKRQPPDCFSLCLLCMTPWPGLNPVRLTGILIDCLLRFWKLMLSFCPLLILATNSSASGDPA